MTDTECKLLRLLKKDEFLTADRIAAMMALSEKTIRRMIGNLNDELSHYDIRIVSKKRKGYIISIGDEQKFRSCMERAVDDQVDCSGKRVMYLKRLLVQTDHYLKLDELSEQLYISRKTISRDIKQIERHLKAFDLQILRKPGYGIILQGEEFKIRQFICSNGMFILPVDFDKEKIQNGINACLFSNDYMMSDVDIINLINYLFVSQSRISENHRIQAKERQNMPGIEEVDFHLAAEIVKLMEADSQCDFDEPEIAAIAIELAAKKKPAGQNQNFVIYPRISELVTKMLAMVDKAFSYDLSADFELRMSLGQHLAQMEIRLLHFLMIKNPILQDIKTNYPLAYAMALHSSIAIEEYYRIKTPQDEVGYLAIIFALALERRKTEIIRKNIILVCASGKNTAELLKIQYMRKFGQFLGKIETCDVTQLSMFDFTGFDYIFTMVPIQIPVPIPIEEVATFLNEEDIPRITNALRNQQRVPFEQYFPEELFFTNLQAKNREEVLAVLCHQMTVKLNLPETFYESVCKRERLARTAFGNMVALPHAYEAVSDRTYACVAILDNPITWEDEQVQVVFLLSIEKNKNKRLHHFYKVTMQYLSDCGAIRKMIHRPNYGEFIQALRQIENDILKEN